MCDVVSSQPPAVLTRILGELGDLETVAPTYAEDEAAVMIQVCAVHRHARFSPFLCNLGVFTVCILKHAHPNHLTMHNGIPGPTSRYK